MALVGVKEPIPQIHKGPPIPAMTSDAEREAYYRLAKAQAGKGTIVELGAWLGASTAYIAAGLRDSGVKGKKVQVYDKFESKAGHAKKVKAFYDKKGMAPIPQGPCLQQFGKNLGDLVSLVEVHPGLIEKMTWGDDPISLLITDAPKRVPQISPVLTTLRKAIGPGTIMAWQDFCHFPSYEIPACLYRIRDHIQFLEAIVPGTTLIFQVNSPWSAKDVSLDAFDLKTWTPEEIAEAWYYWLGFVSEEKRGLFQCGRAMFLCDIGFVDLGVQVLRQVREHSENEIHAKWAYLRDSRQDFVGRYGPLFRAMGL